MSERRFTLQTFLTYAARDAYDESVLTCWANQDQRRQWLWNSHFDRYWQAQARGMSPGAEDKLKDAWAALSSQLSDQEYEELDDALCAAELLADMIDGVQSEAVTQCRESLRRQFPDAKGKFAELTDAELAALSIEDAKRECADNADWQAEATRHRQVQEYMRQTGLTRVAHRGDES